MQHGAEQGRGGMVFNRENAAITSTPSRMNFHLGTQYTRPDVKEAAGLRRSARGGDWDTGLVEHNGEYIVFANIGTGGRTGHRYSNQWEAERLRWYHKTKSRLSWPSVTRLFEPGRRIHVFHRDDNSEPFVYAGLASAVLVADTSPVEVLWEFGTQSPGTPTVHEPEEVPSGLYPEGAARQVLVNSYERNHAAREACLQHHGRRCAVCDFSFFDVYGEVGDGFIHVHHLLPLADVGAMYVVNPIADLRPVCPNCHAMLHRRRPALTVAELRSAMTDRPRALTPSQRGVTA